MEPEAKGKLAMSLEFFKKDPKKDEVWVELDKVWALASTTRVSGRLIWHLLNTSNPKELRKMCLAQLAVADEQKLHLLPALRERAKLAVRMQLG